MQEGDSRNEGCGKHTRRVPLGKKEWKTASYLCRLLSFHSVFSRCFCSQLGIKKKKYMPYNHQHKYFFISECRHSPAIPGGVVMGLVDPTFDP